MMGIDWLNLKWCLAHICVSSASNFLSPLPKPWSFWFFFERKSTLKKCRVRPMTNQLLAFPLYYGLRNRFSKFFNIHNGSQILKRAYLPFIHSKAACTFTSWGQKGGSIKVPTTGHFTPFSLEVVLFPKTKLRSATDQHHYWIIATGSFPDTVSWEKREHTYSS